MKRVMNVVLFVLVFAGCKIPYTPPVKSSQNSYLVVEGFINGNGSTTIQLSRTRNLSWGDTAAHINETGAMVTIKDQDNNEFPLVENGGGIYSGNYSLNPSNQYCLAITTSDAKSYVSDFVPIKPAPPIDTITWNFKNGGVQLYANTHDPSNNTKYYRWSFEETWEFHPAFNSHLIWNNRLLKVVPRTEQVDTCWQTHSSKGIYLGSSAKLNEDVITNAPINLISQGDERISVLYSILVTQYALDSSDYNYWTAMKNNTENVGSIFDPQPNETRGNIHSSIDTSEIVIGYIGAGSTRQQRTFISNSQMPPGWNTPNSCYITDVPKDSIVYYLGGSLGLFPIDSIMSPPDSRYAYTSSFINCVDCTYYGTNQKPAFWP